MTIGGNNSKALRPLYFLSFFLSIQFAFTAYINSTYLASFISNKSVGLVYTFSALLTIWALLQLPKILPKICNHKILTIFLGLSGLSLVGLALGDGPVYTTIVFFTYIFINYLIVFSRDIFIESYSADTTTGKTRGTFLTIINLGWIIAPLTSGLIINKYGFGGVYWLAFFFMLLASLFLIGPIRRLKDPGYHKIPVRETIKKIWTNLNIRKIYLANFSLQFFYAWMVVYTPIYLNQYVGLSWEKIGIIFMIMLTPFVLIEYPLGRLADKIGEKKILILGFVIAGLATAGLAFLRLPQIWSWAVLLFLTRIGAATIEVMSESYFFRQVSAENTDIISFFRNTYPLAYVIAPLIATGLFLILPFKYIFLTLGIIMLLSVLIVRNLNHLK